MNLKCGYFTVGGIMCGSLVGIFVGALAVNASLGYIILLLGAWGLCLYITSRSLMDDARREELGLPGNYNIVLANPPFSGRVDKHRIVEDVKIEIEAIAIRR